MTEPLTPDAPAEGPLGQTLLRMGNRIADLVKERDALLTQVAAQPDTRLREALETLYRFGYQPMYNGRPSCPFCNHFIDDEDTHSAGCALRAALATEPAPLHVGRPMGCRDD